MRIKVYGYVDVSDLTTDPGISRTPGDATWAEIGAMQVSDLDALTLTVVDGMGNPA